MQARKQPQQEPSYRDIAIRQKLIFILHWFGVTHVELNAPSVQYRVAEMLSILVTKLHERIAAGTIDLMGLPDADFQFRCNRYSKEIASEIDRIVKNEIRAKNRIREENRLSVNRAATSASSEKQLNGSTN
jgi:hypothetical protein